MSGQFMWDLWRTKWRRDTCYCECFSFPLSISFHHCSVVIFIYMLLLPEGPEKKQDVAKIRERRVAKNFHFYYHKPVQVFRWNVLFSSSFNQNRNVSTNFRKNLKYETPLKSVRCESRCPIQTDGRTDKTRPLVAIRSSFANKRQVLQYLAWGVRTVS